MSCMTRWAAMSPKDRKKPKVRPQCVPIPLLPISAVTRMLRRQMAVDTLEARLILAVLMQSVQDCVDREEPQVRCSARQFLLGPQLQPWCELIGLEAEFVRYVAREAGFLTQGCHAAVLEQGERANAGLQ